MEQLNLFRAGQSIIHDERTYSPEEIDEIIDVEGWKSVNLGAKGSDERVQLALKLFHAMMYDGYKCRANQYRVSNFIATAGGQKGLSPYLGATPKALHAAFVIILIDTGWNMQPTCDLKRNPFIGSASRGKRRIRSLGSTKVRAGSIPTTAPVDDSQIEADLVLRGKNGKLSGVNVIEYWLEMTAPLRKKAELDGSLAADRLWIWREQFSGIANTNLSSVGRLWWYDFLDRVSSHPRLGKLGITHQSIRKTVLNIAAAQGVFNIRVPMALGDHSSRNMTNQYLTETTLHAVYAAKMREFIELWEATAALGIDDAARHLGISEEDLKKRQQLGLASGLDFAFVGGGIDAIPTGKFAVESGNQIFVVSVAEMEKLHLARLALRQKGSAVQACNPGRWLRSWLPWQVVVDGFCEKIENSRFKAKFRKVIESVERRLLAGSDALPMVV